MEMSRINTYGIFTLLVLIVAIGCTATQEKPHPEWDKTVTLPSGEVVLDMSGEWDTHGEFYGILDFADPVEEVTYFSQEGNTLIGVRQTAPYFGLVCLEAIKGELNREGFIMVYAFCGNELGNLDWVECKWEIGVDGNRITLDCGERLKYSFTRK